MELRVRTGCDAANLPSLVESAGANARFAWEEFFFASVNNLHTRRAYLRAVKGFLAWCDDRGVVLRAISPADVGQYLSELNVSIPSRKQALAGLRHFFDRMVTRHAIVLNPALSVRGERFSVIEGKTPEITTTQARQLLDSISTKNIVSLRDKVIISILIYTAARVGAVAKLKRKHLLDNGDQLVLHFLDKGGKSREIPVRHDLQRLLSTYLESFNPSAENWQELPMFPTAVKRSGKLSQRSMTGDDIARMLKRRFVTAGLPKRLSPHSFRVATITDLLHQGVPLEDVQLLAGHADPRTTRLYDRRQKKVTRNIVERISI